MKKKANKAVENTTSNTNKEATGDELVDWLAKLEADIQTKVNVKVFNEFLQMHAELKVENADLRFDIMLLKKQIEMTDKEVSEMK